MNFISASGPQTHLSMSSLQAAEATTRELQERSKDISRTGSSAYPPPSFVGAPPVPQSSFAPSYNPHKSASGSSSSSRAFSHLGKRRMHDDDE